MVPRPTLTSAVDRAGLSTLSTSLATSLAAQQQHPDDEPLVAVSQLLSATVLLFAYVGIGVLFYSRYEKWSIVDALYFSVVSSSTVGYGDLSPSTKLSRWFTSAYVLGALTIVWYKLASAMQAVLDVAAEKVRGTLARWTPPSEQIDLDGDGFADLTIPPHWALFYARRLAFWVLGFVALQLASAAVFVRLEPGWTFEKALYHCWVTGTTVGFGDVTIATKAGRQFASAHILTSVTFVASFISALQGVREVRAKQVHQARLLLSQLDATMIQSLDVDGNGVDRTEFVVGMLAKLGVLTWDDARPFIAQFDALDSTRDGRLNAADLTLLAEHQRAVVQKRKYRGQA